MFPNKDSTNNLKADLVSFISVIQYLVQKDILVIFFKSRTQLFRINSPQNQRRCCCSGMLAPRGLQFRRLIFHCLSLSNCFLRTLSQETESDEMYLSNLNIKNFRFSKATEPKKLHELSTLQRLILYLDSPLSDPKPC